MTRLKLMSFTLLGVLILLSFSSNPPQGRTGGPGERTCASAGCHSSTTPAFDGHIELSGLPKSFNKDESYSLSLDMIVDRGSPMRGGFQMMVLTANGENADALENPGPSSILSSLGDRRYFEHDPALRFDGKDTLSYQIDWRYTGSEDEVILYATGCFANGNGGASGDRIIVWSDTFSVAQATAFSASIEFEGTSCSSNSELRAEALVEGGQAPFTYNWSTGDTTKTISNISAGAYSVTVTDANQQQAVAEANLSETLDTEPPLIFCLTDTLVIKSCDFFSYPIPTAMDNCSDPGVTLISGLGPNRSFPQGISLEIYEAFDESGNTSQCTIVINNTVDLSATIEEVFLACHFDSIGSVNVEATGDNPPFMVSTLSNGLTTDSLTEGSHTIVITDNTGCLITDEVVIRRPDSITVEVVEIIKATNATSGDGAIDIEADGGSPPFTYLWRVEDEDFSTDEDLDLLFPGTYRYFVTDSRGCEAVPDSITLDVLTLITTVEVSDAMSVYPIPAIDYLKLDIDMRPSEVSFIEIYSADGKRVKQYNEFKPHLNISDLVFGSYFILMKTKEQKIGIVTFIKQ